MSSKKTVLGLLLGLAAVVLLFTGSAFAAEIEGAEGTYRLAEGEVVEDDLYIAAENVIIDGIVFGDVFAAGSLVEINGEVRGDLFAAGAGVVINGIVEDDARVAGGGVEINGTVGDDLFAAAGGGSPFPTGPSPIPQGLFLNKNMTVGGDAYIGGGEGQVAGSINGDLFVGMGSATLGANVEGDATVEVGTLTVTDDSNIAGTLTYSAESELSIPANAASSVEFNRVNPATTNTDEGASGFGIIWSIFRIIAVLVGFAILAWLVLRFRPQMIKRPASVIQADPGKSAVYGLIAAVGTMFIPLISMVLILAVAIFWGGGPAVVLFMAIFSVLALLWIFSPLITGYWLGKTVLGDQSDLMAAIAGVLAIVLLTQIPFLGWLVSLVSFVFALGAMLLSREDNTPSKMSNPGMLMDDDYALQ